MPVNRTISRIILFYIVILLFKGPVCAESASIAQIDIFNSGKKLVLNAALQNGFSENIIEAIKSGVPVAITYTVVLKTKTPFFFDKKVAVRTIKRSVEYDTLTEEYSLSKISGKQTKTKITSDFDEVLETMTMLQSIPLILTKDLNKEKKYYAMVKARLSSERSWFPFNYILFFVPFLNFDTSWENSSPFAFK